MVRSQIQNEVNFNMSPAVDIRIKYGSVVSIAPKPIDIKKNNLYYRFRPGQDRPKH